mmetsp:Transcript_4386/g.11316  ORF Transcript_4386/g.11316 Transcript_4386/m.11316 type:complete len:232 (-) Transcript_4386:282-977(-)
MHQRACDLLKARRLESHTDGSALWENHRCSTGGCRGSTCFRNVSCRSLLWSKSSLISRTDWRVPGRSICHSSSMMWRMPLVLETHSIRPQLSAKMTTLKVFTCRLRRRAFGLRRRSWFTMTPNSIMRESLRRSPRRSALQRKGYSRPSSPMKVSFFGRSLVRKTSICSLHRSVQTNSGKGLITDFVSRCERISGIVGVIWCCSGTMIFHLSVALIEPPSSFGKLDRRLIVG